MPRFGWRTIDTDEYGDGLAPAFLELFHLVVVYEDIGINATNSDSSRE